MKTLFVLLLVHLAVCGLVGYFFQMRTETHRVHNPPVEVTTSLERARGEATFLMAEGRISIRFPSALVLYFVFGLISLMAASAIELYQSFFSR